MLRRQQEVLLQLQHQLLRQGREGPGWLLDATEARLNGARNCTMPAKVQ